VGHEYDPGGHGHEMGCYVLPPTQPVRRSAVKKFLNGADDEPLRLRDALVRTPCLRWGV